LFKVYKKFLKFLKVYFWFITQWFESYQKGLVIFNHKVKHIPELVNILKYEKLEESQLDIFSNSDKFFKNERASRSFVQRSFFNKKKYDFKFNI